MSGSNPYSNLSDVYSFGICLYELLSGYLPYRQTEGAIVSLPFSVNSRTKRSKAVTRSSSWWAVGFSGPIHPVMEGTHCPRYSIFGKIALGH